MPAYQTLTKEAAADRIRARYAELKRIPGSRDFNGPLEKRFVRLFGSHEAAVQFALGLQTKSHHWTRAELIDLLVAFHKSKGSDFSKTTFEAFRAEHLRAVGALSKYFDSFDNFLDAALGCSPPRMILLAIEALTVPSGECSIAEIANTIKQTDEVNLSFKQIARYCNRDVKAGILSRSKPGRIALYSLTPYGRKSLIADLPF